MCADKTICQRVEQSVLIWPWVLYTCIFAYLGIMFQAPLFTMAIIVLGIGNILKRVWKRARMKEVIHHE